MDFYKIKEQNVKKGVIEIYPDFHTNRSDDLMIRGNSFYAIWNEHTGLWSTDEFDVIDLIDSELRAYYDKCIVRNSDDKYIVKYMNSFSSGSYKQFKNYMKLSIDNYISMDSKIAFANTEVKKSDYISKRLPYELREGNHDSYDELISTLYSPEEKEKIEWAIGAIISGDALNIQKFIVLYGEGGTGKSTVLNIIQSLFKGYYVTFDAKELVVANNAYTSGGLFNNNPLVAIQHDGDLSGIKDNSKLNSIVAHEEILVNEKFKSQYVARANCFLFMGTNKPVKITDAKSGIIRRLIDVHPTGNKVSATRYKQLINQIKFELGAIAYHCLEVYKKLGEDYYKNYRPMDMLYKTDPFFNFVEEQYFIFKENDGVTLKAAYALYKEYCTDSGSEMMLQKYRFREELKNYFKEFQDDVYIDNKHMRSYFSGFLYEKFERGQDLKDDNKVNQEPALISLNLDRTESQLDKELADCPAQYANDYETPSLAWNKITTKLSDLDTKKLHYVKPKNPNHIVIDFDLKDDNGEKSYEKNLEAASKFPPTYAETSKSGNGIHLHYIFDGDVTMLSRLYDENIEVKVFTGNSSLRRKLNKCNGLPIAHISEGLPLKGDKKMVNFDTIKNEKAIRTMIIRNLNKEYHAATKPSIDFIYDILNKAYDSGMHYDVSDLQGAVYKFAMGSTNQADYCMKLTDKMKFKSEEVSEWIDEKASDKIIFFDVEVFQNVFILCWKLEGDHKVVQLINPKPTEIEALLKYKLVGFNNRKYDNHILYAAMMGYKPYQLYTLSQKIIEEKTGFFGEAYNLSYTDIYDYAAKKQGLKKWEIELDITHLENSYPWDEPLAEEHWQEVAEYCANDVIATEAVWNATQGDFKARLILSELAGMTPNDTTNTLTTRYIFGKEKHPKLTYTDLSTGEQW